MRSRKPFIIYWPQYFQARRTRSEGRRLPKTLALDRVELEEIAKAGKRLGYMVEIERFFRYPRTWYDDPGRVLINTKGKKKNQVMREIAKEIRKMRTRKRG